METSLYREIEKKTIRDFNLRCIDGSIHGCGRCVGYCTYEGHEGFLTHDMQKKHKCLEKGCYYHHIKPAAPKKTRIDNKALQKEILSIAQSATYAMEGLRVIRVVVEPANCIVYYAAIAKYDISSIEKRISTKTERRIRMKQIPCDFNVAAALVMA